jgi:hypothetical protein
MNRERQIRLMDEGRCDERLKVRVEESTCLTYTGFHDKTNLKYLEIKMRSTSEKSTNTMGDHTIQARWYTPIFMYTMVYSQPFCFVYYESIKLIFKKICRFSRRSHELRRSIRRPTQPPPPTHACNLDTLTHFLPL